MSTPIWRRMALGGLVLVMASELAACGRIGLSRQATAGRVTIDDVRYRARAEVNREDRRQFVVRAGPVSAGARGAQEAARFQANRYCLRTYGSSDKTWIVSPDLPLDQIAVANDRLAVEGRCTQR